MFLTMVNVSSSASASLLVLRSTGTSCIRDNILAAAFLLASFLDVPLPRDELKIMSNVAQIMTTGLMTACQTSLDTERAVFQRLPKKTNMESDTQLTRSWN